MHCEHTVLRQAHERRSALLLDRRGASQIQHTVDGLPLVEPQREGEPQPWMCVGKWSNLMRQHALSVVPQKPLKHAIHVLVYPGTALE